MNSTLWETQKTGFLMSWTIIILFYGLPDKSDSGQVFFAYFSTKTYMYVGGTQKNRSVEHPKHIFTMMGKKIIALYHVTSRLGEK